MFVLLSISACDMQMQDESISKTEYSILQSYEYEYREARNDTPYMVLRHASGAAVVAFPVRKKSQGYVMILAKSEGKPEVKAVPNADFIVAQAVYMAVKEEISLSAEVDRFIVEHVR